MPLNYSEDTHRRYNILTGEWILVSPHRTKRPWQGKQENLASEDRPSYDASCYLCPENKRASGEINPAYKNTYVFTNDFGALIPDSDTSTVIDGLLKAKGERGICKVICFSPDHSLTLANMKVKDITEVIKLWSNEYQTMGDLPYINHVQIFENKGATMGCSNPHPHGQIWAQSSIPKEVQKKDTSQKEYWNKHHTSLLGDYLKQEIVRKERIIYSSEYFVALVPFWAVWPYEVMIVPKRQVQNITLLTAEEQLDYAAMISVVTSKYDRLFNTSFPYSSGIHQAPTNGEQNEFWHMHMLFYPPLLRSATVKKFMVGYEMFATPQRDITAEMAADKLRQL